MSKPRLSAVNNSNIYMTLILTAESGSQTNRSHRERYTYANTETPVTEHLPWSLNRWIETLIFLEVREWEGVRERERARDKEG